MANLKHKTRRVVGTAMALTLLVSAFLIPSDPIHSVDEAAPEEPVTDGSTVNPGETADESGVTVIDPSQVYSEELLQYIPEIETFTPYADYLDEYQDVPLATEAIDVDLTRATAENPEDFGVEGEALHTVEAGSVTLPFSVETPGLYELVLDYEALPGSGTAIERRIYIDDEVPYAEASNIILPRTYQDRDQSYKTMERNQSFPSQVEVPHRRARALTDANGYYVDPLRFYLDAGDHTITFEGTKEPMALYGVTFEAPEAVADYETYLSNHEADGAKRIGTVGEPFHIQGEDATYKTSPSLFPLNDRTSPVTEPYHPSFIRLNTIGGTSWSRPGQVLDWEIEVPESGLYRLAFRFKQDENTGNFSTRELRVNGAYPFKEARHIRFGYDAAWQVHELGDGEQPYLVYLEAGRNTLSLEVTLDEFASIIHEVEEIASELNGVAQDIVVITSTAPDRYRDYQLTRRLPNMVPTLTSGRDRLQSLIQQLYDVMGGRSDKTATLEKTQLQLDEMLDNPREIASMLPTLQSNITGLGNWALQIKSQSLTIDYMALLGADDELPRARANFFENVVHELRSFIGSFTNDMDERVAGGADVGGDPTRTIEVWVTTGRDQMDIISRLLNESFEEDVQVQLRLVSSATALSATAAGRGPDVLIQTDSAQPIDFAFRDSAYDLTQFDDFEEVVSQVHPAALEAFAFDGGYYAVPDQMSFPVLFYRADILSELQIPVPQTWEDIITIVPFLQNNNMEFFMEVSPAATLGAATQSTTKAVNSVFLSMLYQSGGELYNQAGTKTLIDSPEGQEAFSNWTDYYTKHSFPVSVDFVTRFRLGSVPLAIVNFTSYTTLSVSAPEIRGDWGIAPIPGTRQEDGSISRELPAVTSAGMLVRQSVEKSGNAEAGWKFLKWWISAKTQTDFAAEMESLLGSSARYPVANLEAFDLSPWPQDAMAVLQESLESLRKVRQVPGSYITGRNVENAFYEVVNNPEIANTRRTLTEWTVDTNEEITSKRREFGLDTTGGAE